MATMPAVRNMAAQSLSKFTMLRTCSPSSGARQHSRSVCQLLEIGTPALGCQMSGAKSCQSSGMAWGGGCRGPRKFTRGVAPGASPSPDAARRVLLVRRNVRATSSATKCSMLSYRPKPQPGHQRRWRPPVFARSVEPTRPAWHEPPNAPVGPVLSTWRCSTLRCSLLSRTSSTRRNIVLKG